MDPCCGKRNNTSVSGREVAPAHTRLSVGWRPVCRAGSLLENARDSLKRINKRMKSSSRHAEVTALLSFPKTCFLRYFPRPYFQLHLVWFPLERWFIYPDRSFSPGPAPLGQVCCAALCRPSSPFWVPHNPDLFPKRQSQDIILASKPRSPLANAVGGHSICSESCRNTRRVHQHQSSHRCAFLYASHCGTFVF